MISIWMVFLIIAVAAHARVSPGGMVGGVTRIPTNSSDIQELALFSADHISKASNSVRHRKLVKVTDAFSQVVAGIKYKLVIVIVDTKCHKNAPPPEDVSQCEEEKCMPYNKCNITIWQKPWMNFTQVQDFSCISEGKRC